MRKSNISSSQSSNSKIFDSQAGEELNDAMENVQVAIRIRGLNPREQDSLQTICVLKDDMQKGRLTIGHTNSVIGQDLKEFHYDQIFGPNESQQTVFENVGKQMALACLSGYNVCIFAYGQTGAGKTFTMMGNEEDKGLIQRILNFIFAKLKSRRQEFVIQSQYYEIYMEEIIDLYQPQKNKNIRVVEDFNGVRVENLSMIQITNHHQAIELIQKGQKNRHVGATRMNAESSRSHSIFTMKIHIKDKDPSTGVVKERQSKLHFVDLAGSERQKQTQVTGQRFKEAAQINQSLTTLGMVINALAEGQKTICYRNSKLTHILKDSLGGNSKTLMIAAVSPSSDSFGDTLSTLKFALRAKSIKNNALINEKPSENIDNLKKEIETLKTELQQAHKNYKLQQELIQSYSNKKYDISNSPLISQEQQQNNSPVLSLEEKQILIKSVEEFQVWLKEFLIESGFLDFIQELRQRMGININDMMCVESARDVDSQQWSSLFQVPVENLKEYIKTIMEFNKFTGMITGQYDIDLKNKNSQLNSKVHQLKEEIIKKELQMVDYRNSIINEMKAQSQIGSSEEKNQTIAELKSMVDQYVLENNQHLNSIAQMEEDLQRKEESIGNLHEKITHLLNDIQKMKKKKNYADLELKEINENLLKMNEKSEAQIKQLQNEIDSLQMQNVTLLEELEQEQQKYFLQKEEYERKQERHSTLVQTVEYKTKLIDDLQIEIAEERKQMALLYKNFSVEKEQPGVTPFSNLWKFIQNIITDYSCERDQKNHLIEEIQGLCLHEASMLKQKSEAMLHQSNLGNEIVKSLSNHNNRMISEKQIIPQLKSDQQQKIENQQQQAQLEKVLQESVIIRDNSNGINVNRILSKEYLIEYIASQNQQLSTWNIVGKQLSDSAKKENNTIFNTTLQAKLEDSNNKNRNNKFNQKDYTKMKSQSDIRNQRFTTHSPSNSITVQQNHMKEFNIGEKQKIDAIQQLIQDNKVLSEGLLIKLDEVEKIKQDIKNMNEANYKMKQDLQSELNKFQEQSKQNQTQLNQQLSQIISFDLIKQNLEDEINILKLENTFLKEAQADNVQKLEQLTREKDQIEDSNFFYQLQTKKFQEKLKNISTVNEEYQQQILEKNILLTTNKKQITNLERELSLSQSQLIHSNQKIIEINQSLHQNKMQQINKSNAHSVHDLSYQSLKQNLNPKFQTVSPAHKTTNNKNGNIISEDNSEIGGYCENIYSPLSPRRINLDQTRIDKKQNENANKVKQQIHSDSSEFYSALSSFSKLDAFSQKASMPPSIQNSNNQVNQQKQIIQNNVIEHSQAMESVQKQLNFNFPSNQNKSDNKRLLSAPQFSFLAQIEKEEERIDELENKSLPKFKSNSYSQHSNKLIQSNSKNEQQQLQQQTNSKNGMASLQSEKKELKQLMHEQQQEVNNSLNIQNTLNVLKYFEQKDGKQKQNQKHSASSSQSSSFNNTSSNQSLPEVNQPNKKRSFMQILDQIEEDDSENKICSLDLIQTMYNNNLDQQRNNFSNDSEDDDDDDEQDILNLKETIYKKRFNEQDKPYNP